MKFKENGIWLLEGDDNFTTAMVRKAGRLDWDDTYRKTPELMALKPGQIVFDVGAYIGDSTKFFLDRGCEVWAFEPQKDAYECLTLNCPKATCYDVPIGNGVWVTLHQQSSGNLGARRCYLSIASNLESSKSYPLDFYFSSKDIHCLKIDVEGFEWAVLEGAQRLLQRCRPLIVFEVNPHALAWFGKTPDDLLKLLPPKYETRKIHDSGDNWDLLAIPR